MKVAGLAVPAIIGLLLIEGGCGKEEAAWGGRVEKIGGVTNVHNPAKPRNKNSTLVLEEELSIGGDEGHPGSVFSRIGGLAVDGSGNIYVIDSAEAAVRVFDKHGQYLRTIGRRGQGPGETQYPVFVQMTADKELAVYDYSVARLLFFSLDGTYLRQKTTPRPVMPIGLDSQGKLIAQYILAPPPLGGKQILRLDQEFTSEQELAREEMGKERAFDIGRPSCYAALSSNDRIIWGDSNQYALHVLNPDGRLVMKITKEHRPLAITNEEESEYRQKYAEPLKAGMKISFRGNWPAFSGLFIDDEGRILVRTYERAGEGANPFYYDVFNRDGVYEAKVSIPLSLDRNSVWKNGRVYTVGSDENGSLLVKRHRVTWRMGTRMKT